MHWPARGSWYLRPGREALGVKPLYWSMFLLRLAQGFSGIFVPVYLVEVGLRVLGEGALLPALGLMFGLQLLARLVAAVAAFPAAWAARAFGFRWVMLFANVLRAGVFLLLMLARENVWLLPVAMVFSGMLVALFWPSFHTVFTEDGQMGHFGKAVGWRAIAEKAAQVVGPVVGGVIVTIWGFSILFGLGVVVVLLASGPVFLMRHHDHADKVSLKELWGWLSEGRFRRAAVSFVGFYINEVSLVVIWPVFVFLILGDYEQLGLVFSVTALVMVVGLWLAGRMFDRGHKRRVFKLGSIATGAIWLVRGTLKTLGQVIAIDSIDRLVSGFYLLPYQAYSYERAKGKEAFSFMVYRELLISVGAVGFWAVAIGLLLVPGFWYWLFSLAAVGTLVSQFILEEKE